MVKHGKSHSPGYPSKFSPETKARAVRLVRENSDKFRNETECIRHVCEQMGMATETLRKWVHEARAAEGEVEPRMDWKDLKIAQLEKDNAELQQTIEVLKAATSFFARECDPQSGSSVNS